MKKIVILGCENSHAEGFLDIIKNNAKFSDVEVIGVYSDEKEPCERIKSNYGIETMESYDTAVGRVDGVVVTARHGDNHLKYALPYIKSGVPMFIDKPVTISENEVLKLARLLKESGVRVTGGSSLRFDPLVMRLAEEARAEEGGKTLGGFVSAPLASDSTYGGFYFYAQHLCDIVGAIFGKYPRSVKAYAAGKQISVVFRYQDFDVTGEYIEHGYSLYSAFRVSETKITGSQLTLADNPCFHTEFDEFYKLLCGEKQSGSYKDFIAPVFVMNAIVRSLESGNEEKVNEAENI
ncbi:MAG: Gfo/Idh/MocA family oxidoreductase [Clostridia bacterium]|nr:Gfo/Idh/MocA family oxidoreductase [Clostridia bacterium]